jgi:superfamily II DNA/RNA helicase
VQAQAVPAAIAGRDLLVSSQTGSGKTAAFMLPALNRFATAEVAPAGRTPAQEAQGARARGERVRFKAAQPKMLVLTPTRELALQVTAATEQYTTHHAPHPRRVDPGRHALPEADATAGQES